MWSVCNCYVIKIIAQFPSWDVFFTWVDVSEQSSSEKLMPVCELEREMTGIRVEEEIKLSNPFL